MELENASEGIDVMLLSSSVLFHLVSIGADNSKTGAIGSVKICQHCETSEFFRGNIRNSVAGEIPAIEGDGNTRA